ncbi:MAG: hypothetical protein RMJ97_10410 [Raineya sp.]|nr:hypothetical protein [Raineya sp.]MDW8297279.1 hypothetical protein [Raineya sp.]
MKHLIFYLCFLVFSWAKAQIREEAQVRMEFTEEQSLIDTKKNTATSHKNIPATQPISNFQQKKEKLVVLPVSPAFSNKRVKKNLKFAQNSLQITDSLPQRKSFFSRLGCFLKEPLELIALGVELFELTKPPKNAFGIVLYVIYIVPLFAIITAFILGGVAGLATFILISGAISFLIYWGILALMGISLAGAFIFWGLLIAFVVGLIIYLLLIRLC